MIDFQALFTLIICLLFSFFFSGSESGFVSLNPIKVGHRAASGSLDGKLALFLMNHKDRLVSTILICNNICNIGATLSFVIVYDSIDELLALDLSLIPSPESWFLTPALLLFGEILPKTLFRIYPFRLTLKAIPLLLIFYFLTMPLNWLFSKLTDLFRKESFGFEESFKIKSREEMVLMAIEGSKQGTLFESADMFINNVLKLKDKTVSNIVIPISEFKKSNTTITCNQTIGEFKRNIPISNEVVVFDEQGIMPLGFVTMLDVVCQDNNKKLHSILKPLKKFEINSPLLTIVQAIKDDACEFYLACDQNRVSGIIQKMRFYNEIFGKYYDRSEVMVT